ncbi:MAG: hypothetical protein EAZ19_16710 [Oscillatoriales cyanobacterium]|nr:MAG: hypothetical protein EAZ88_12105 [Oscillatoriales cyanobacterium]TAF85947.1 MAG: hypothetical protein EAZ49_24920 [Oscillatoriales cyanobacterium]TAG93151.1 MAG: hypothetical protein EAZ19_16710 [Oscillatoriales cyanobacterium]
MFGQGAFFDEPKKDRRDACSTYSNQIGLAQDKNLFVLRDSLLNKDFRISRTSKSIRIAIERPRREE